MITNNKRKGFTLVELLVVIAILAILAATAVVGYTSFIKKANRSNALSELNQIRNVVTTLIIVDGEEIVALESGNNLVFDYDGESLSAHLENPTDPDATFTEQQVRDGIIEGINILADVAEAEDLNGTLSVVMSYDAINEIYKISEIKYEYVEGVIAVWNIAANTVEIQ